MGRRRRKSERQAPLGRGPLFEGGYGARPITDDSYFLHPLLLFAPQSCSGRAGDPTIGLALLEL